MKNYLIITVILMTTTIAAFSQQNTILEPQVRTTSGGSGIAGNFYMSYTIGQTVAFRGQAQNTMLTQGFQQPLSCMPYQDEEICFVTTDTLIQKNQILWYKTYNKGTEGYVIYKEISTNVYDSIGYVSFSQPGKFTDLNSNPEQNSYRYKIAVVDTCNNKSQLSSYHQTMFLQISLGGLPSTMVLSWTPYVDESGSFIPANYYIYKGTSPASMTLYATLSGSLTGFTDYNVFDVYYYRLSVQKNDGCDSTINNAKSYSNTKDNGALVGINNNQMEIMKISPNPMSSYATLTVPNAIITDYELRIIDVTGKTVRTINSSDNQNNKLSNNQIKIDRGSLKAGVYFVELKSDRIYRGKLIIN